MGTGWLLLALGTGQGLGLLAVEYAVAAFDRGDAGALASVALWAATWLWAASLVAVGTVLPLLLPDGRLLSRR